MITPDYIRHLLESVNERQYNLDRQRQFLIDTESEIIEMICIPAQTYGDRIQSTKGEKVTDIVARIPLEIRKQKYEMSFAAAINEAQRTELTNLRCAVSKLEHKTRLIIDKRYYKKLPVTRISIDTEDGKEIMLSPSTVLRRSNEGIKEIAEIFNRHGAEPIEEET